MHYKYEQRASNHTDSLFSLLFQKIIRAKKNIRVIKDSFRQFEADAMLDKIPFRLPGIPLERQHAPKITTSTKQK